MASSVLDSLRPRLSAFAAVVAALLATGPQHAFALVSESGDVSPPFAAASAVNLAGQRIFIGSTIPGAGGQIGTVTVNGGGVLTAAQLVAGYGGLGTGFVTVSGLSSLVNLTGGASNNGLDIGSWGTGTMTVSNGGSVVCSSPTACANNNIGNAAGSTGTLIINGGSVTGLGTLAIAAGNLAPGFGTPGANTTGTLSISNGGVLTTTGASSVAQNGGATGTVSGNVTIDGAGSRWTITRDANNVGGQANLNVGRNSNSSATMMVSNGGNLTIVGSRVDPASDNSLPALQIGVNGNATGTMTVTTGGSVRISGDTGIVNVGGNTGSTGGTGTLNITAGGTVAGTGANGLSFVGIGRLGGATGTVNISGAGSSLTVSGVGGVNTQNLDGVGGLVLVGGTGGNSGTLNVTNGGSLLISDGGQTTTAGGVLLRLADGTSTGTATIAGAGTTVVLTSTSGSTLTTPTVRIGNGGTAQMTIRDGATVSLLGAGERDFIVGGASTGSGSLSMSNNATIVASRFAVADNGGFGTATVDHSSINLDGTVYFNGNPIGAALRVGRGVGADGTLNLQNGSTVTINNSIDSSSVILGGTSALAGGTGRLNMSGGSSITFTGNAASASLQVGGTSGTGFMTMTGASTVYVGATGNALVGATSGSQGTLSVASGSSIVANTIQIGGNSDTAAGGIGTVTLTGAGSALVASGGTGLVTVGRGGTGSLAVTDQAALAGVSASVGRGATGVGSLTVDNSTVSLSGQQTVANSLSGANLSIGVAGGTGTASIANGSVVSISNSGSLGASLNVGGRADPPSGGGTGVLTVNNSQVNIIAAPGQAVANIGYDGTGTAILTNSQLNVGNATATGADGNLYVGAQAGGTGLLSLNSRSVVNANYVGVGMAANGPGGSGTLVLNDSTINAQSFEVGASGLLTGNNGLLHVAGGVTVAGTISPGNSPGAIRIDCDLVMLPGSLLILDVLGTGESFNIDHLRIGDNSTFDLHNLHILLNFLGNTDPTAFAASGQLNLDNFLQAFDVNTGELSGLSTLFAPGQTWLDVVGADNITSTSPVYGDGTVRIAADGSLDVVPTAPIPEPSTWGLLVAGLAMVGVVARRRAAVRRA